MARIVVGLLIMLAWMLWIVASAEAQLVGYLDRPEAEKAWNGRFAGWAFSCQNGEGFGAGRGVIDATLPEAVGSTKATALVLVDGVPRVTFWQIGVHRPDVAQTLYPLLPQCRPAPANAGFVGYFYEPLSAGRYYIALQLADIHELGALSWQGEVVVP